MIINILKTIELWSFQLLIRITNLLYNILNSAEVAGNIESDGDSLNVFEKGICWSTTENPTIANSKKAYGYGKGSFTINLTELQIATQYYVRAYATNVSGTYYGNEIFFITSNITESSYEDLIETVQDETQISSISDEVITDADEYVNANLMSAANAPASEMQKVIGPKGATVTVVNEGNPFPKVITLDYGSEGITGKRGNIFKGKIIVRVTNRMDIAGSRRNYSFNNFSVNDNQVKGQKIATYNGETNGKRNWTVVVSDTIVKASDSKMIVSNSTRIRTRISDNATPNVYYDDKYSIEGSATGINAKGVAYTMSITKPLITDVWPIFVEGTMLLETEKNTLITDYGDGTRDMKATVTVNGVTKTISFRK